MPVDPLTTAAATAWAWDKYGKSLTDKAVSAFKEGWTKSRWKKASDDYRAKVKRLYGTMQIMGMAEEVPLDDIFTEAYLLNKPTAFSRFDIERLKQASADPEAPPPNARRVTGLSLVKKNKNLFILGKPGAGKTTFLKYIAVQAAEPDKPVIDKVPIFVSLKRWADSGAELMPFIEEQFDKCDFPAARPFVDELLKSGGAIVLFDGLDEVNQEGGQRDKQTLSINNFIEKYDRTQCLITCRLAASDYSFKPFTYVELADFTPKQIETFVGNWFRNNEGEKDEETSESFLTEFKRDDNTGLRDLARTPLLLTLLCLSFNETLTFPQRRVEIYKEALDALLKKWDSSRKIKRDEVYRKLSIGHKENMLARIAAETFEKNQYFIPQAELKKLITDFLKNVPPHDANEAADGENILKAIEAQHGIFVERAREVYSFSHLTFQEYFTARYIVDNATKGTLRNLVKEHRTDKRWREVFLLTASLLPDAYQFMKLLRNGLDELLGDDEKLKALLAWADSKSSTPRVERWEARVHYLAIECSGIYDEVPAGMHIGFDPNLDLDFYLLMSYEGRANYSTTQILSRTLGLNTLEKELKTLPTMTAPITSAEISEFDSKMRTILAHRNIRRDWKFTETQVTQLADYVKATNLLMDCLELAFMPPDEKEAMLNSLYLPLAQTATV
jgi:hypothetical protein